MRIKGVQGKGAHRVKLVLGVLKSKMGAGEGRGYLRVKWGLEKQGGIEE